MELQKHNSEREGEGEERGRGERREERREREGESFVESGSRSERRREWSEDLGEKWERKIYSECLDLHGLNFKKRRFFFFFVLCGWMGVCLISSSLSQTNNCVWEKSGTHQILTFFLYLPTIFAEKLAGLVGVVPLCSISFANLDLHKLRDFR